MQKVRECCLKDQVQPIFSEIRRNTLNAFVQSIGKRYDVAIAVQYEKAS